MAEKREKYIWLLWTIASTLLAYFYLSFVVTITFFLSGIIVSSKCLVEDFLALQEEDKQKEENH